MSICFKPAIHRPSCLALAALICLGACTMTSSNLFASDNVLGQEIQTISFPDDVKRIVWSADQTRIAVTHSPGDTPIGAGKLAVYDLAEGRMLWNRI